MSDKTANQMKYVRLGKSGLKVSRIILWVLEEDEALKHIKLAYDLGINAFDTANIYSHGESERILGNAIKKLNIPRDEIVIMTKVHHLVGRTAESVESLPAAEKDKRRYANQYGLSRKAGHRFDYDTPIEETMQALYDVVKAGYVRYIGMSSCYAWQFYKMQSYARAHGLTEFICVQNL
ncbi:hypothetical protein FS837_003398 [Tulasnella sp. UAMH 9824]|nr:hypothetical protein FS837_003398 [Tulasnella sp. UAMH 9824]